MRAVCFRSALAVGIALTSACKGDPKPIPVPQGYLFEKGPYQGYYDRAGKLLRLLYDQNGDKKADVVMLFFPNGKVRQVESDSDFDGKVDRWQYYSDNGVAEKEGYSRKGTATPDTWQYFDAKGNITRREIDENGDGKVDRTENFQKGRVAAVGVDSDGDGRIERWQTWAAGRVVSEELDTDGDGIGDRRLRYGANGRLAGMDVLTAQSAKTTVPAPATAR
jgi:hypothetical protein